MTNDFTNKLLLWDFLLVHEMTQKVYLTFYLRLVLVDLFVKETVCKVTVLVVGELSR